MHESGLHNKASTLSPGARNRAALRRLFLPDFRRGVQNASKNVWLRFCDFWFWPPFVPSRQVRTRRENPEKRHGGGVNVVVNPLAPRLFCVVVTQSSDMK
jgi:hypothetical protein